MSTAEMNSLYSVKDLLQYFEGRNVRIYLFGSWPGRTEAEFDIDIAIELDDISYELTLLRERLEESTISRQGCRICNYAAVMPGQPAHPTEESYGKTYRAVSISHQAFGKFHELAIRDTLSEIERDASFSDLNFL